MAGGCRQRAVRSLKKLTAEGGGATRSPGNPRQSGMLWNAVGYSGRGRSSARSGNRDMGESETKPGKQGALIGVIADIARHRMRCCAVP